MAKVLRRYGEVLAALRDPVLSAQCGQFVESLELLAWNPRWEALAAELMAALPGDPPVDLLAEFARPWSTAMALEITGAAAGHVDQLVRWSELVAAGGDPQATSELARYFAGESMALKVQAFVALTQTLPAFLGNAWLALLQHPTQLELLCDSPELLPAALEELLRFAGPSLEVYRPELVLCLSEANRDEAQFADAVSLDLRRSKHGHLAFGAGSHACAGAALIRKAAGVATGLFLQHFRNARITGELEYLESKAIRSLRALWVVREQVL